MKFFLSVCTLLLALSVEARTLKLMEYNTENFFDTKHDEGTDDYTYLTLPEKNSTPGMNEICHKLSTDFYIKQCLNLDWNEARFTKKIMNISKVIRSFDNTGNGPDIVVLEEIENKNVLNMLVTKGLDKMGYQSQVLIEGDDSRGIDTAIISKFPVISSNRHPLIINGNKINTRGILEVVINVEGKKVVVYGNHWPSQSNPLEERAASARLLSSLADKQSADLIIALGDFNSVPSDIPSPFTILTNFTDAEKEARKVQTNLNPGTHFFKGGWTSLDHIFIHKKSSMKPLYEKFQIINRPFMMKQDRRSGQMIPNRFDTETAEGFSDHLPLGIEVAY